MNNVLVQSGQHVLRGVAVEPLRGRGADHHQLRLQLGRARRRRRRRSCDQQADFIRAVPRGALRRLRPHRPGGLERLQLSRSACAGPRPRWPILVSPAASAPRRLEALVSEGETQPLIATQAARASQPAHRDRRDGLRGRASQRAERQVRRRSSSATMWLRRAWPQATVATAGTPTGDGRAIRSNARRAGAGPFRQVLTKTEIRPQSCHLSARSKTLTDSVAGPRVCAAGAAGRREEEP